MMVTYLVITEILKSKAADDDDKGDRVYRCIKETVAQKGGNVVLDFKGIELVNTAFFNNAVGKLFNKAEYDMLKNNVRIVNLMNKAMIDVLEESISNAIKKYS